MRGNPAPGFSNLLAQDECDVIGVKGQVSYLCPAIEPRRLRFTHEIVPDDEFLFGSAGRQWCEADVSGHVSAPNHFTCISVMLSYFAIRNGVFAVID